jgi:hypothetical protein
MALLASLNTPLLLLLLRCWQCLQQQGLQLVRGPQQLLLLLLLPLQRLAPCAAAAAAAAADAAGSAAGTARQVGCAHRGYQKHLEQQQQQQQPVPQQRQQQRTSYWLALVLAQLQVLHCHQLPMQLLLHSCPQQQQHSWLPAVPSQQQQLQQCCCWCRWQARLLRCCCLRQRCCSAECLELLLQSELPHACSE